MHRMTRGLAAPLMAAMAALALTACSGDSKPDHCLDATVENPVSGQVDADLAAVVDCSESHYFAVYAVLDLPDSLLAADQDEAAQRAHWEALLTEGTDVREQYDEWRVEACNAELLQVIGLDEVEFVGGRSAADVELFPLGRHYFDSTLVGVDAWVAGDRSVTCALAWVDPDGENWSIAFDKGVSLADFLTDRMPEQIRECWNYESWSSVSCDQQYWAGAVASIDAGLLLGDDLGDFFDMELPLDLERRLNDLCAPLVPLVTGTPAEDERFWGPALRIGNWWEGPLDEYRVDCMVSVDESETHDVIGSLFGIGDRQPVLVPIG